MKKIEFTKIAIQGPIHVVGYDLTHSHHPGREFVITRETYSAHVAWEDRPFDSLGFWVTAQDPLAQRCGALVEMRLGVWYAYIPDVCDARVASREAGKNMIETTLRLRGDID